MKSQRDSELLLQAVTCNRRALMAVRDSAAEDVKWRESNRLDMPTLDRIDRELIFIAEAELNDWPGDAFCPVI